MPQGSINFTNPSTAEASTAENGMSVKVDKIEINDLGNGYSTYTISYTETNYTDNKIPQATFKLYFDNAEPATQYGFFDYVLPGENFSISNTFTSTVQNNKTPLALQYHSDHFFSQEPLPDALNWSFSNNSFIFEELISNEESINFTNPLTTEESIADNGLSVQINNIDVKDLGNGYTTYTISYTETNYTDTEIPQATFRLYFDNSDPATQYGYFGKVLPGEDYSILSTFTTTVKSNQTPLSLQYHSDHFSSQEPLFDALNWSFEDEAFIFSEFISDNGRTEPYLKDDDQNYWDASIITGDGREILPEEAQLFRVYLGAMDRLPDEGGFNWWLGEMQSGRHTLESMAGGFISSEEFKTYADHNTDGHISNGELINQMYTGVFDREPDEAGYKYWVNRLDSGDISQERAFVEMTQSNEFVELTLTAISNLEFI